MSENTARPGPIERFRSYAGWSRLKLHTAAVIVAIHVIALALAPFTFTWTGLILLIVGWIVTGLFGVTMGFHRLLTHMSFKTYRPVEWALTTFGVLALEGGPITWVAEHRYHHKESDEEADVHTPFVNFMWSHILWLFFRHPELKGQSDKTKYALDLQKQAFHRFMERWFFVIYLLSAVVAFLIGWAIAGPWFGLSMMVWGVFLRTVFVWHATWLVNSATHMWGYRNYKTKDNSRNTWWVSLITFGEGWHNNHHAQPRSAAHGHKWYEVDFTYYAILVMTKIGLAWDVIKPRDMHRMATG